MFHQHAIVKETECPAIIGILKWTKNGIRKQSPWQWIKWIDSGIVPVLKSWGEINIGECW